MRQVKQAVDPDKLGAANHALGEVALSSAEEQGRAPLALTWAARPRVLCWPHDDLPRALSVPACLMAFHLKAHLG